MKEKLSAGNIIGRFAERSGITKKLAAEVIRAIPEIIEEGLYSNGEAKVRGLGTFRLKTVAQKKGRNPKTGEEVIIPSHQKLIFLPEESFREQANEDYKFFGIRVMEEEPVDGRQLTVDSGSQFTVRSSQSPLTTHVSETLEPGTLEPTAVSGQQPASPPSPPTPLFPLSESERGPGGEAEPRVQRRNYWLIPVIIVIVAALSVVFYWRNFRTSSQFAVRSSQEEVSSQQPFQRAKPEGSTVSSRQSAVHSSDSGTLEPGTIGTTGTRSSLINTHLFQLAREVYGNPFLWVLIYRANQDKIKDPDLAVTGENIVIPSLEGTPKKLSRNDSLAVSDGYRLVYEYYLSSGDARAEEFKAVMEKYQPE